MFFYKLFIVVFICCVLKVKCDYVCHNDPSLEPIDGLLERLQFNWLGTLQYIHIKSGNPHYFRVPRVVLVGPQFVLSTAKDAGEVPPGYALGNVVFGDYERDETECDTEEEPVGEVAKCDPAILLMPISDVLLHPEYKNFRIVNSVALLKLITPIKSSYMIPVCMPTSEVMFYVNGTATDERFRHIDFTSVAPRDFSEENRVIVTAELVNQNKCAEMKVVGSKDANRLGRTICTHGCGFHSGAPTVFNEHTGHWTLVALSAGGPACKDPLRTTIFQEMAQHIPIAPYAFWIDSAMSGKKPYSTNIKDDPFGYATPPSVLRQGGNLLKKKSWVGHWWIAGLRCYDRGESAKYLFRFYYEIFKITPYSETPASVFNYFLEVNAPDRVIVECVKVNLPRLSLAQPTLWGLGTQSIQIAMPLIKYSYTYTIRVEGWGRWS